MSPYHLILNSNLLNSQGSARKRNQRIPGLGETDALRHEDLQAAAQEISQSHPRNGDDESGLPSSGVNFTQEFIVSYQL